jgi:hypothetical protein
MVDMNLKLPIPLARLHGDMFLNKGGIIGGNNFENEEVKTRIKTFRRDHKISVPMHISKLFFWFWYKP